MSKRVLAICAEGTRGKVKGKPFVARRGSKGFALHSEELARRTGKALRFAVNKIYVETLEQAAEYLKVGGFHIRMWNEEHKQWNLRQPAEVKVFWH